MEVSRAAGEEPDATWTVRPEVAPLAPHCDHGHQPRFVTGATAPTPTLTQTDTLGRPSLLGPFRPQGTRGRGVQRREGVRQTQALQARTTPAPTTGRVCATPALWHRPCVPPDPRPFPGGHKTPPGGPFRSALPGRFQKGSSPTRTAVQRRERPAEEGAQLGPRAPCQPPRPALLTGSWPTAAQKDPLGLLNTYRRSQKGTSGHLCSVSGQNTESEEKEVSVLWVYTCGFRKSSNSRNRPVFLSLQ